MKARWSLDRLLPLVFGLVAISIICQPLVPIGTAAQPEDVEAVSSPSPLAEEAGGNSETFLSRSETDEQRVPPQQENREVDKPVDKKTREIVNHDDQFDGQRSVPRGQEEKDLARESGGFEDSSGLDEFPPGAGGDNVDDDAASTTEGGGYGDEKSDDEGDSDGDEGAESPDPHANHHRNFSESDVVHLTPADWQAARMQNKYILLLFYTDNGRASTAFRPYFAKAATALKEDGNAAVLAKMDFHDGGDIAAEFGVDQDPALVWFDHGTAREYTGSVTSEDIVQWVKKKSEAMLTTISTKEELTEFLGKYPAAVVGYFTEFKGDAWNVFCEFAKEDDTLTFGQTNNAEVAAAVNIISEAPAVVVIKHEDEKWVLFDGKFEYDDLYNFFLGNKMPLVSTYSAEIADKLFLSPIQRQVVLFAPREKTGVYMPIFKEACKFLKGDVLCVYVDNDDEEAAHVLVYFETPKDEVKVFGYVGGGAGAKHSFDEDMTVEKLTAFAKNISDMRPPSSHYTSQPVPEDNNGDVTEVVGQTFEEIVLDETKDVFLKAYAPWCQHCKDLVPTFNKLGAAFRDVPSVVIAKIDATANEHPRLQTLGYPTLLFFKADQKSKTPVVFQGERSLENLIAFVRREASIPFTLPTDSDAEWEEHRGLESVAESDEADESTTEAESHEYTSRSVEMPPSKASSSSRADPNEGSCASRDNDDGVCRAPSDAEQQS
ncbi:hypothetical protein CBR_g34572 [Chara braunii]|uniref:protein disulfide-isomerase n=1 Tax=Chara braunii TaxID=69332 RepID=A0A388LIZ8_CHABU|nr:hypothetical protein CBR_g34572 [Chara braunii]|eukprot:GBG82288.1 hypothetical protein CBR_g34572 [Chara braunii]